MKDARRIRRGSGAIGGLVFIAAGVVWLLHNLGVLRVRNIFDFWPILPIIWGSQAIVRGRSFFSYLFGGLAVGLGSLKLLDNLDILTIGSKYYAPLILITLGVAFLARNFTGEQDAQGDSIVFPRINPVAIFGAVKRRVESQEFEGGEITAVFGGVELDFRRAKMKGDTASVEANAVFGGVHLRLPDNWIVEVQGVALFGGYEDKTIPPREGEPVKKLIVTGNAVFGGVGFEN